MEWTLTEPALAIECVERARSLAPAIAAAADETERERRVAASLMKQMHDAKMFRVEQAVMTDIWSVMGLRGTGSDKYTVTDLFVPEAHAAKRDDPSERRHPALHYCVPTGSFYASGFAGLALGIGRATLDEF